MLTFNVLKKYLKKDFTGLKKIKIAILADSASQFTNQALRAYGYLEQYEFEIYEADYNQIDLQIFDYSSELYVFKPQFVFINISSEHLLKHFYKLSSDKQIGFAKHMSDTIKNYVDTIDKKMVSNIIINTFFDINDSVFGNYSTKVESSFIYQIRKLNILVSDLTKQFKNLFICDIASMQSQLGYYNTFDPKMYVNGDMVYNIDFYPYIAKGIVDIINAVNGTFKKCLILDLDNTLWGGIIGDDGVEGIQIGDLGLGKAFTELQLWAKQLKQRGIILAICSKNTEAIAKEPFIAHPDMILSLEDIAVFVANWETKVDNIRYIQSILNISFESMVFLDDNPFEREMVKSAIPELSVPDLPEDPAEYMVYLRKLNLFETASFTEEDSYRTKQYQEEAQRNILQKSFLNEDDFLANLDMVSEVKAFDGFTSPRVAQLSQRSNQFNLRTVRYTESDIKAISASPDYFTLAFTLADKFGDHGLISAVILQRQSNETLFIDTWIMSCRVLKRGMENFALNAIVELAKENGFKKIKGEYLATKKNALVKDHFANLAFEQSEDGTWVLDVNSFCERKTFINIKK